MPSTDTRYAELHGRAATGRALSSQTSPSVPQTSLTNDHGDISWLVPGVNDVGPADQQRLDSAVSQPSSVAPVQDDGAVTRLPLPRGQHGSPQVSFSITHSRPALSDNTGYPKYPYNPDNVLDNVLPRGLLYTIIDLYFEYIYPLTPLIHRPSFERDVNNHRENRQGEDEWVAMVLSLVAMTITQLPHPLVPMSREDGQSLVQRCYQYARGWIMQEFETFTVNRGMSWVLIILTSRLSGLLVSFTRLPFIC